MYLRKLAWPALLAIATLTPTMSQAVATFSCSGTFDSVLVRGNGDLMVHSTWRGDWTYLCNVNAPAANVVNAKSCAGWLALSTAAVDTQKPIMVSYINVTPTGCSTLPIDNTAPAPDSVIFSTP